MRKCTKNYVEGTLRLYPKYVEMIKEKEASLLNPDEFYIDQNTGGGSAGFISQPTEQKAMILMDDDELTAIKHHKKAIESILRKSDFITVGIIEAHYFGDEDIETIANDLGTTPHICSGLKTKFLVELATKIGLLQ